MTIHALIAPALPAWSRTPEALALLQGILAEPPEQKIGDACGFKVITYRAWKRPDVAALKKLRADWWEANHEGATSLPETADEVIHRLLTSVETAENLFGLTELNPDKVENWL